MGWFLAVYHKSVVSAHRVGGQINFHNISIGNQSCRIRVENALFFDVVSLAALASQQTVSTVLIKFSVIKSNGKYIYFFI